MDWYHWYPALYEADTLHLTLAEHGAYRKLIDFYMATRQPIPDDDRKIATILRVSLADWEFVSRAVRGMFKPTDGKLRQKRCDRELEGQDRHVSYMNQLSKRGVEARKKSKPRNVKDNLTARSTVRSTRPSNETRQDKREERDKTRPSVSFSDLWKVSPLTTADIEQARKEFPGYDIEEAERDWCAWAAGQNLNRPRKPGIAFLGWLDKRDWKKGNSHDH